MATSFTAGIALVVSAVMLSGLSGCSAADEAARNEGPLGCAPGSATTCACINGSSGMQTCQPDGSYGSCTGCGMATNMSGSASTNVSNPPASEQPTDTTSDPNDPSSDLEPVEPGPLEPEPVDPEPVDPEPVDPEPVDPEPVDPEPVDPEPVDPEPIEPWPTTGDCDAVADWDPLWAQWEEEVLLLVNERRAQGANCGSYGSFGPAAPLTMNQTLRCSSRLHSWDMAEREYFDHVNPDGDDPFVRMAEAGYAGGTMGENIALGPSSPQDVVSGWMGSDGHCANIMEAGFTEIGVGLFQEPGTSMFGGPRNYWTQNFGGPGWGG